MSEGSVIRDPRAGGDYFAGDVLRNLNASVAGFDSRLSRPVEVWAPPHARGTSAGDAMKPRWARFRVLYSMGASVEDLRDDFLGIVDAAVRERKFAEESIHAELMAARFRFGQNKDPYSRWLWLVSLALVFDVDDATFDKVVWAVHLAGGDQLIDRLIATRRPDHPIGERLAFPTFRKFLNQAFEEEPAAAAKSVGRYLTKWYQGWKGTWGWDDHILLPKPVYYGYWAFETVGVVKALGLDDSSFRDNEYYPRDLAGL